MALQQRAQSVIILCEDVGCHQAGLTAGDVQCWQCEPSDSDWCL